MFYHQTGPFCTVGCVGDVDDDEALPDDGDDNAEEGGVVEDEDGDDNALSYFSKISLAWALKQIRIQNYYFMQTAFKRKV